jgi:hypothetical protein
MPLPAIRPCPLPPPVSPTGVGCIRTPSPKGAKTVSKKDHRPHQTNSPREDVYSRVTARIVADLERGTRPWMKP